MSVANMGNARRKRGRRETTPAPAGPSIRTFITSWQLSLEAAGKSPRTVRSYTNSVRALCAFLDAQGMPSDVEGLGAEHLRGFLLAEERARLPSRPPSTSATCWCSSAGSSARRSAPLRARWITWTSRR